jgi:hypothetical protein
MRTNTIAIGLVALVGALGCQGKTAVQMTTGSSGESGTPPNLQGVSSGSGGTGGSAAACNTGRSYVGFGGTDMTVDRVNAPMGEDRDRQKPYTALTGEFPRVLGNTPGLLASMGPTFADPGPRWYEEAKPNAVSVYSAFRIAFQGCLSITASGATFQTSPDGNSAPPQCTQWTSAFWSRTPTNDEVAACSNFAVNQTTGETDPTRQWAYACASVLTASQFMSF